MVEIKTPPLGESIEEAVVGAWSKREGESVARDEALLSLETEKVNLEVYAPVAGVLKSIKAQAGATVAPGEVLGVLQESAGVAAPSKSAPRKSAPAAPPSVAVLPPSVRRLMAENGVTLTDMAAGGYGGRLAKADVLAFLAKSGGGGGVAAAPSAPPPEAVAASSSPGRPAFSFAAGGRGEERRPLTLIRRRIAERLKAAQRETATLTTFNEVDMSAVKEARLRHGEAFLRRHGVKLGFMGFFVRASAAALAEFPVVNARLEGKEMVLPHYADIAVAVATPQGLLAPVLRNAEAMDMAAVERAVAELARRAADGALRPSELTGGTFTITNGGVFGSLMSTPLLNPPQAAILGMHAVRSRPVVVDGEVRARPMMYLALSYDHCLIDGREAVSFLARVRALVEAPERMLLGL